jgi:WD40 repeat protein
MFTIFNTNESTATTELRLVSSDLSGLVVLWDRRNRNVLHILKGHSATIKNIVLLPGEDSLVTGSHDGSIRIWDLKGGTQKAVLQVQQADESTVDTKRKRAETVSAMLVLEDGRVITGGVGGFVRVWDSASGSVIPHSFL